jgi:hypothetical protein
VETVLEVSGKEMIEDGYIFAMIRLVGHWQTERRIEKSLIFVQGRILAGQVYLRSARAGTTQLLGSAFCDWRCARDYHVESLPRECHGDGYRSGE